MYHRNIFFSLRGRGDAGRGWGVRMLSVGGKRNA